MIIGLIFGFLFAILIGFFVSSSAYDYSTTKGIVSGVAIFILAITLGCVADYYTTSSFIESYTATKVTIE